MRQTTCAIALVLGSVPFVTVPQLPPRAQSQPVTFPSCNVDAQGHYGARPPRSVYVPMRDGVRIALEIVLPDGIPEGTRLPTILSMTRYWRAEEGGGPRVSQSGEPQFWLSHGYALVVGDVRGTGASFGVWRHHRSRDETLDFSEIVDWIIAQPWSDQQVVGFGVSYSANTADWMAERNHPALKAIVSRSPDYDPYADLYFPGGIPNAYMGRVWGLSVKEMDLNVKVQHPDGARGIKPVDGSDGPRLLQQAIDARRDIPSVWEGLRRIVYRDDRPPEWAGWSMDDWGIHGWRKSVEQSRVPIQSWGSWMDAGTANGVLHRFMTLSNPQHVFVGAWSHGGRYDADPYRPNDASADPPLEMQWLEDLCFVETHLQGRPGTARSPERLLTYFTMGEERWKTTTTWPPPGTEDRSWYFAAGRTLVTTKPTNREGADRYTVDFEATTGTTNRWATNNTGEDVRYPSRRTADRRLLTVYEPAPARRHRDYGTTTRGAQRRIDAQRRCVFCVSRGRRARRHRALSDGRRAARYTPKGVERGSPVSRRRAISLLQAARMRSARSASDRGDQLRADAGVGTRSCRPSSARCCCGRRRGYVPPHPG